MASNTTDSNRVEQAVSSLINHESHHHQQQQQQQQQRYQPKTFNEYNTARYVYLPLFPTKTYGPNDYPLLANVPGTRLTTHEILQRQRGAYTSDALMMMNNYNYWDKDGFTLSEDDAQELATRLNIGLSIITFNAERLRSICYTLLTLHESFRRNILQKKDIALHEPILNSKQMAIALEFFLQMDVDVFHMKTCSFRGANPSQFNIKGFFCEQEEDDEPTPSYQTVPCNNLFCSYCSDPRNQRREVQSWTPIDFSTSSMHQFVNGYTAYLNCPATCTTTNIIYTITCSCGHYDYVDSTSETLSDAMTYHQKHANRIIHEKLTGSSLYPGIPHDPNEQENAIANKMRLYQHLARCPMALRLFLDRNPSYWCFIPLFWHDAEVENIGYFEQRNSSSSKIVDLQVTNLIAIGTLNNYQVNDCLIRVPLSPATYAFSCEQKQQQRLFFQEFLSLPIDQLPYSPVHLYKIAIVFVLPDKCSTILRYIMETLFIIHGETKLNMICPIGRNSEQRYGRPHNLVWCHNLNCPFVTTTITHTSTH